MKIAIFSDLHLGFGERTERKEESFQNAKQAFEIAIKEKADAILLPGDLFDSSVPSQETWEQTFRTMPTLKEGTCKLTVNEKDSATQNEVEKELNFETPIIAIHGTHEFRTRDYTNALKVLESAGCITYIHATYAIIEKNGEKVAIHGLGGVPEKKALDVLQMWNPKPVEGMPNLIMLHQSIKEYLPVDDDMVATIGVEHLPKGFDLIIDGHLHWSNDKKLNETTKFLLPGSTIITQMKKLESKKPKGVTFYNTKTKEITFTPLPHQRSLIHLTHEFKEATAQEVIAKTRELIQEALKNPPSILPLIRLRLRGTLATGVSQSDISIDAIKKEFEGRAVFSISKDFFTKEFKSRISELRAAQKEKLSVAEMGLDIMEKHLSQTRFKNAFDTRRVFDLLVEGRTDDVVELLSKKNEPEKTQT